MGQLARPCPCPQWLQSSEEAGREQNGQIPFFLSVIPPAVMKWLSAPLIWNHSASTRGSLCFHLSQAGSMCMTPTPLPMPLLCVFFPILYVNPNPHVLIQLQLLSQGPLLVQSFWPMLSEILFHL